MNLLRLSVLLFPVLVSCTDDNNIAETEAMILKGIGWIESYIPDKATA